MTGKKTPTEPTVSATAEPAVFKESLTTAAIVAAKDEPSTGKQSLQVAVIPPVATAAAVTEVRYTRGWADVLGFDGVTMLRGEWTTVPDGARINAAAWPEYGIETRTRPAAPAQE